MRPPLRSVRMGFLKNIASPMRRWRRSEAVRVWVSAEGESRGESEARWKRAIFSNPTHAERQRRVRGVMADVHAYAYALRRCATTGERGAVRRADPFSVNPGQRVRGWSGEGDMHRKAVPL